MSDLPDFNHNTNFSITKSPHSEWQPGQKQPLKENESEEQYKENVVTLHADKLASGLGYKLLVNSVLPRPVAFVSTKSSSTGVTNISPFSFFNVVGADPPALCISVTRSRNGLKDTARNILDTKEYTVNIISEWFVESANYTTIDAPSSESEFDFSGVTQVPSEVVKPPRVKESAISMECKLMHHYPIVNDKGETTADVFIGRVIIWHIRKEVLNVDHSTDLNVLKPVSRLGGVSFGRTTEAYNIARPVWETEKAKLGKE